VKGFVVDGRQVAGDCGVDDELPSASVPGTDLLLGDRVPAVGGAVGSCPDHRCR
jgi:hypothetical protein